MLRGRGPHRESPAFGRGGVEKRDARFENPCGGLKGRNTGKFGSTVVCATGARFMTHAVTSPCTTHTHTHKHAHDIEVRGRVLEISTGEILVLFFHFGVRRLRRARRAEIVKKACSKNFSTRPGLQ